MSGLDERVGVDNMRRIAQARLEILFLIQIERDELNVVAFKLAGDRRRRLAAQTLSTPTASWTCRCSLRRGRLVVSLLHSNRTR